jgi:ABC transporter substrate-binding protein (ThiB subfamily)
MFMKRTTCLALAALLLASLALAGCKKEPEPVRAKPQPKTFLNVYALQNLRDSGFEAAVLKEFARKNNTGLRITLFPDPPSLLAALSQSGLRDSVDVVMGLDSAFAVTDSLLQGFSPLAEISQQEMVRDLPQDAERRILPYAYANLAIIYDSKLYPDPPKSFGELQDARYYSQLALCDPASNGVGRSSLFWSVALFNSQGYEQFWNSLRKNVRKVYDSHSACLEALRKGECGLMFGYNSIPAWIQEFYPSESHIKAVVPVEGSYRYVEYAALSVNAPHRSTAIKFLQYLISADTQQFVMFKLGMLPVNGRTPLPRYFARIPLSVYTLNSRLNSQEVAQNLPLWLENWNRLIRRLPGV